MNAAHESETSPSDSPAKVSWVIVAGIAVAVGIVSGLLGLMLGTLSRPSNGQYLESVARADSAEHELAAAKRSWEDSEKVVGGLRAANEAKDRLVAEEKTRADRLVKELSKLKADSGLPDWANPEAIATIEKENKELQRKLTAVERTLKSTKEQRNRLQEEHDERLRKNVAKDSVPTEEKRFEIFSAFVGACNANLIVAASKYDMNDPRFDKYTDELNDKSLAKLAAKHGLTSEKLNGIFAEGNDKGWYARSKQQREHDAPMNSTVKFSGNGSKSTETFSTKSPEWKVAWECEEGIMISVRSADEKIVEIINSQKSSDSSIVRSRPGRYYLHVIGTGDWSVAVQE
jgi:hypothetical protein